MLFVLVADADVNDVVVVEEDVAGVKSLGVKRKATNSSAAVGITIFSKRIKVCDWI